MSVAYRFRIRATSAINSANFSACGGSLRRLSHLLVDSAAAGCHMGLEILSRIWRAIRAAHNSEDDKGQRQEF